MEDPASDKMISTTVEVIQPKDEEENSCGHNCLKKFLTVFSIILIVCTFPFSLIYCVKIVREYERAVLFRLGILKRRKWLNRACSLFYPAGFLADDIRLKFDVTWHLIIPVLKMSVFCTMYCESKIPIY